MARQIVVLALVLFAVVGFAYAESPAGAPADNSDVGAALLAPGTEDQIGNTDGAGAPGPAGSGSSGGDEVVEGPVGGPVAAGAAAGPSSDVSGAGAASAVKISTLAGVATLAAVFFY